MSVEVQEFDTMAATGAPTGAATGAAESHFEEPYPTGGEVSAMTLIADVRAIRQRLDGVEVALRGLGLRMEELTPATGSTASSAASAPPGSLEELRHALTGDLQADLRKNAKQSTLFTGIMLLVMLSGLGGLGWMVHQVSQLVKQLE